MKQIHVDSFKLNSRKIKSSYSDQQEKNEEKIL